MGHHFPNFIRGPYRCRTRESRAPHALRHLMFSATGQARAFFSKCADERLRLLSESDSVMHYVPNDRTLFQLPSGLRIQRSQLRCAMILRARAASPISSARKARFVRECGRGRDLRMGEHGGTYAAREPVQGAIAASFRPSSAAISPVPKETEGRDRVVNLPPAPRGPPRSLSRQNLRYPPRPLVVMTIDGRVPRWDQRLYLTFAPKAKSRARRRSARAVCPQRDGNGTWGWAGGGLKKAFSPLVL